MKDKKITNVKHVAKTLAKRKVSIYISKVFMKGKENINVKFVATALVNWVKSVHEKNQKCYICSKIFGQMSHLMRQHKKYS